MCLEENITAKKGMSVFYSQSSEEIASLCAIKILIIVKIRIVNMFFGNFDCCENKLSISRYLEHIVGKKPEVCGK